MARTLPNLALHIGKAMRQDIILLYTRSFFLKTVDMLHRPLTFNHAEEKSDFFSFVHVLYFSTGKPMFDFGLLVFEVKIIVRMYLVVCFFSWILDENGEPFGWDTQGFHAQGCWGLFSAAPR